jgi:hypothetical protein
MEYEPIANLRVDIVRFVDEYQPGIVECEFVDAEGALHRIIEKVPIVSLEDLWSDSEYPRPGIVRCRIRNRWRDETGAERIRIDTSSPDSVETVDECSEFVVFAEQIDTR